MYIVYIYYVVWLAIYVFAVTMLSVDKAGNFSWYFVALLYMTLIAPSSLETVPKYVQLTIYNEKKVFKNQFQFLNP